MKYMLMMNTPRGGPYKIMSWPQKDIQAHIGFMKNFARELGQSGELVEAEGLAGPDQAKLISASKDGVPVTDGVFPEAKEFLAGYWIVECDSFDRATEIAGRLAVCPAPEQVVANAYADVRPIMESAAEMSY